MKAEMSWNSEKSIISIVLLVLILMLYVNSQADASTYDLELPPGSNYAKAAFRFWQPENITNIKAVAVLVPGLNGDGRDMADDPLWQSFARRHDFALLAVYFVRGDPKIENYCQANLGSGAALMKALSVFSQKSGHPEVENAPLILWGHSAGGQFNYELACWKPERIIAFIVNKGGYYHTKNPSVKTRSIPAIFFIGAKDEDFRIKNITEFFQGGRSQGALWALAVEPNAGHEVGGTLELAMSFFETIIPLRLGANGELADLTEDSGWVGDTATFAICPMGPSTKHSGSWLPDEFMARRWRAFVLHNDDKTP